MCCATRNERARRTGLHHEVTRTALNLAEALNLRCRPTEAITYADRGIEVAREHDLRFNLNSLVSQRARSQLLTAAWDGASTDLHSVLAEEDLSPANRSDALTVLGTIRARRGDPGALVALDEARALALPYAEMQLTVPVQLARAEARWLNDDAAGAARELEAVTQEYADHAEPWFASGLTLWSHRAGLDHPARTEIPDHIALWVDGDVRRAAQLFEELGCPYEAADALGDSTEVDDLRESLSRLQVLGARPRARQVTRRLRDLGVREVIAHGPRASTRANPAGLTNRELEVAALVAQGLTNAEIADALVVSPKTVDHHVSAILGKLGASSRRKVAAAAVAAGIDLTSGAPGEK